MKTIIFISALAMILCTASTAQNFDAWLGLNCACLNGEESQTDALGCPTGGISYRLLSNGNLDGTVGLGYTGSGGNEVYEIVDEFGDFYNLTTGALSVETRTSLRYVQIPAAIKYNFEAGKVRPYVETGATFGLLLSANQNVVSDFSGTQTETETDVKDSFKSTNAIFNFGGGIAFPLGGLSAIAGVKYGLGLTDISANEFAGKVKTRDMRFTLGLAF